VVIIEAEVVTLEVETEAPPETTPEATDDSDN